ncbi:hypothetical protein AgCh_023302 [Apium graveolens]
MTTGKSSDIMVDYTQIDRPLFNDENSKGNYGRRRCKREECMIKEEIKGVQDLSLEAQGLKESVEKMHLPQGLSLQRTVLSLGDIMYNNYGWDNAQDFISNHEQYQNFNSFQNFNAYQVNSFDCYNSYYAPYPPSTDFSYSFDNQYHDDSYVCNGIYESLGHSNPSLLSLGLLKHFDDSNFEISNKGDIPCEVESIGWYKENAKRNIFIKEVQLVMHDGCLQVPPCVNFPTIHDSCLAIDDNFVSDESTCLVDDSPMCGNYGRRRCKREEYMIKEEIKGVQDLSLEAQGLKKSVEKMHLPQGLSLQRTVLSLGDIMYNNYGWDNAQDFISNHEQYQNFNSFQNFNAYQVNSFDCYNSYYAPYPPSTDFSYSFDNQYHDDSYVCNGIYESLGHSNPSLLSLGLLKHFDDSNFEISNKGDIPCEVESIGWYKENAKRNIFIKEVQLVMHDGCLQVPPCVNFPTIHDSCLAIDDNFVSDESTCLVDDSPMCGNYGRRRCKREEYMIKEEIKGVQDLSLEAQGLKKSVEKMHLPQGLSL